MSLSLLVSEAGLWNQDRNHSLTRTIKGTFRNSNEVFNLQLHLIVKREPILMWPFESHIDTHAFL